MKNILMIFALLFVVMDSMGQGFILKREGGERLLPFRADYKVYATSSEFNDCTSRIYTGIIDTMINDSLYISFISSKYVEKGDSILDERKLTFRTLQQVSIPKEEVYQLSLERGRSSKIKSGIASSLALAAIGTSMGTAIGAIFTKNKDKRRNRWYISGGSLVSGIVLVSWSSKHSSKRYSIRHPYANRKAKWSF